MVAEQCPRSRTRSVTALSKLLAPGGRARHLHRASLVAGVRRGVAITPMAAPSRPEEHLVWEAQQRDTFPVEYRMNTRRDACRALFAKFGFEEKSYRLLSDCRTFQKWKVTCFLELFLWKVLQTFGLNYPELCILATYGRAPERSNETSRGSTA